MGLIMKNGIQYPGNASSGGESSYTLPIASTETLGGIKIGENLTITEDGTLNAEASGTSVLSPGAVIYDEQERMIGRWTDGRPLYQKTIVYEGESVSASTVYNHNINNLNKVVNAHVIAKRTGNNMWETYNISQSNQCARFTVNNTEIQVSFINGGWDPYDILLITLQYTKTTDEPNSFRPEMIENISIMRNLDFSNIYSLDEKIIGSWINGKPIYQKTLIISDFNFSQSKDFTNDLFTEIELILGGEMYDTTSSTIRFVHADARKISSNTIRLYNTLSWDSIDAYTLRYTKTTDEENSFTPDMITDHENITDAEVAEAAAADKI